MTHPYTIAQIIPSLNSGGAERICVQTAIATQKAGHKSIVMSSGGPLAHELARHGVEHITLPLRKKNPYAIWANARAIKKIIASHRIALLHAHSRAPAWSCWLASRATKVPFITTFHAQYHFTNFLKKFYNSVMVRGKLVITVSQFIADYITKEYKVPQDKIRVIHCGIDLSQFTPGKVHPERLVKLLRQWSVPEDKQIILLPARLSRQKGQNVLVEAIAKLNRENIICLLMGQDQDRGGYREELMARIKELKLQDLVHFVPVCSDMPAAYTLCDLVVAPSISAESFLLVAAEAQAMGKPLVVSDLPVMEEVTIPGLTARIVPPNDPEALAKALGETLDMSVVERAQMAAKSIEHVNNHFANDKMCDKILGLYTEILH